MSDQFYWDQGKKEEIRELFRDAIAQQFNSIYGTDIDDINAWQNLCQVIGIAAPDEMKACRDVSKMGNFLHYLKFLTASCLFDRWSVVYT